MPSSKKATYPLSSLRHVQKSRLLILILLVFVFLFFRWSPQLVASSTQKSYRVWPSSNSNSTDDWCVPATSSSTGLVFVKTPKAASSTGAGITRRIALKVAQAKWNINFDAYKPMQHACAHQAQHGDDFRYETYTRLWTFIREPSSRALSEFYHIRVSRRGVEATDDNLLQFITTQKNRQVDYLSIRNPTLVDWNPASLKEYILNPYHFIGLVERMEESLAVLTLLWNFPLGHVVVSSAKQSGGYDDGIFQQRCVKIQKPPTKVSPLVERYLQKEFPKHNWDFLLYEMMNQSLDATIQMLGVQRVQQKVQALRRLQILAQEKCSATTTFPCSSDGKKQLEASRTNCYSTDTGCGYPCIDAMLESLSRGVE